MIHKLFYPIGNDDVSENWNRNSQVISRCSKSFINTVHAVNTICKFENGPSSFYWWNRYRTYLTSLDNLIFIICIIPQSEFIIFHENVEQSNGFLLQMLIREALRFSLSSSVKEVFVRWSRLSLALEIRYLRIYWAKLCACVAYFIHPM
jgi:hypothetical protein